MKPRVPMTSRAPAASTEFAATGTLKGQTLLQLIWLSTFAFVSWTPPTRSVTCWGSPHEAPVQVRRLKSPSCCELQYSVDVGPKSPTAKLPPSPMLPTPAPGSVFHVLLSSADCAAVPMSWLPHMISFGTLSNSQIVCSAI